MPAVHDVIRSSVQHFSEIKSIALYSLIGSQVLSNVPWVMLVLPLLQHGDMVQENLMALAVGSAMAGNVFIFGAASNLIILHKVEKQYTRGFNILLFSIIGIPLTIMCMCVYYVYLAS